MTDSDAKDWVTIKVPVSDRDTANDYRPDGATYGDCLVAGAERLNDNLDSDTARFADGGGNLDTEALAAKIADHLNGFEWHIDTEQVSAEVVAKMDYAQLAGQTANELEGRMR